MFHSTHKALGSLSDLSQIIKLGRYIFTRQVLNILLYDFVISRFSSLWTDADSKLTNRNALFGQVLLSLTGAQAPNQGDVLLIGDIDEIPRIGTLTALRNCAFPPRVTLRTQMYYYSYQWLHRGDLWHHPQATYFDGRKTIRPESLRTEKADAELYMAGWHCSSCFRYVLLSCHMYYSTRAIKQGLRASSRAFSSKDQETSWKFAESRCAN